MSSSPHAHLDQLTFSIHY